LSVNAHEKYIFMRHFFAHGKPAQPLKEITNIYKPIIYSKDINELLNMKPCRRKHHIQKYSGL